MSWTDERIDRLREMWSRGVTASIIAEDLGGVSRNAVIGKAHRLGLQSRPSPVVPGAPAAKPKKAKAEPAPAPASAPAPRRAVAEPPAPAPLSEPEAEEPAAEEPQPEAEAEPGPPAAHRPLDRPGRLRPPGPGRSAGADPARAAAPPRPRQAEPRGRRQDQPARAQRKGLQMADRPSGRARFPLLRRARQSRLPLLRPALRRRLSGPAAPARPQAAAAIAVRRNAQVNSAKRSRPEIVRSAISGVGARRPTGPHSGA